MSVRMKQDNKSPCTIHVMGHEEKNMVFPIPNYSKRTVIAKGNIYFSDIEETLYKNVPWFTAVSVEHIPVDDVRQFTNPVKMTVPPVIEVKGVKTIDMDYLPQWVIFFKNLQKRIDSVPWDVEIKSFQKRPNF